MICETFIASTNSEHSFLLTSGINILSLQCNDRFKMATETKTSLNKICHARYNYTTSLTPDTPFDIDIEMNEFSHKLHRNDIIFFLNKY